MHSSLNIMLVTAFLPIGKLLLEEKIKPWIQKCEEEIFIQMNLTEFDRITFLIFTHKKG